MDFDCDLRLTHISLCGSMIADKSGGWLVSAWHGQRKVDSAFDRVESASVLRAEAGLTPALGTV
jgi:hypothetical protein